VMKSERGQATVELAISLTLLVIILFTIIDFGRIFHAYLTLNHASREAARTASLGATDTTITQTAKNSAPSLDPNLIKVEISPSISSRTRGVYVTAALSYPISFSIPLLKELIPGSLEVKAKTVMRVE
jgi:Flp pilus assembly protein TadG